MYDVAVNCVRSKDAQKQLARTSLSPHSVESETTLYIYGDERLCLIGKIVGEK